MKDTTDFINKIENLEIKSPNYIIGTLDVTALYTNIPNREGLDCIKDILNVERNNLEKPSVNSLIDLLEIVLTKNNFQFNEKNYLQIGGTAMGTRVAPTYANLFMSRLEERLIEGRTLKPTVWLRYIDDIFFIWEHGEIELLEWIKYLNKSHKTIKFTVEYSTSEINFLDTKVKLDKGNKMYTDLYVKPTDTNSYLKYDSAHPPKCKESLPYSQFLRIKRICKRDDDYQKHLRDKTKEFKDKGYPDGILKKAEQKVLEQDRKSTLEKKEKVEQTDKEKIYLTTTYREGYRFVLNIVKKNWDILARSSTTKISMQDSIYCRPL